MAPPGGSSCDASANQQISHRCGTGSPVVHDGEEVTGVETLSTSRLFSQRRSVLIVAFQFQVRRFGFLRRSPPGFVGCLFGIRPLDVRRFDLGGLDPGRRHPG
jgi:hypothetical protein